MLCYHIEAEKKLLPFRRRHFQKHLLIENIWISLKTSLKFVPKSPINNIQVLVQIMAWLRPVDRPLFEPMMVSLPAHIYGASLGLNALIVISSMVMHCDNLAPLLSNRISVIHGSRINYETICCPQFCTYSYQILCHVGGTSPPTWHKIW